MVVLGCTLAVVLLAAIRTMLATPIYASSVELFVTTPARGSSQAYEGSLLSAQRVASYARLATSQQLARDVVRELGLATKPEDLAKRVTADVPTNTVILDISVTDTDPARAQRIASTFAERLTATVTKLETSASGTSAAVRLTVVDPARRPDEPISPQPLRDLGLAVAVGLALGLGGAFLRELLDSSVRDPEDVAEMTGVPVLANVPDDYAWAKESLLAPLHARRPAGEAFHVLRTGLQFVQGERDNRVMTVTSTVGSEGKTTTATHLAVAFAQAGHQVLLIDADLRHPGLSNYLEFGDTAGLIAVLIEGIRLEDAVQQGPVPNLGVLTSGGLPTNPSELLQATVMGDLLTLARKTYDKVIIDSPPLLPVADAVVLAAQSDGALLVSRYGKTTRDHLRRAVERLAAVDANILGAVLNRVPKRDEAVRSFAHTRRHAGDSRSRL